VDQVAEVELAFFVLGVQFDAFLVGGVVKDQFVVLAAAVGLALEPGEQAVAVPLRGLFAVVDTAGDKGAVGVAFEEVHQHFLADAGHEYAAPAGAGVGLGHSQPDAGLFVVPALAVPVELDAYAVKVIGVDFFALGAHHGGGLGPA